MKWDEIFFKEYQEAVEHMIGRWVENEERTVGLLSSAEYDEFSPLLITRTRRNIIRPVRKALGVSDARSDYESDTGTSPVRKSVHINPNPDVFPPDSPDTISYSYKSIDESSETKV